MYHYSKIITIFASSKWNIFSDFQDVHRPANLTEIR